MLYWAPAAQQVSCWLLLKFLEEANLHLHLPAVVISVCRGQAGPVSVQEEEVNVHLGSGWKAADSATLPSNRLAWRQQLLTRLQVASLDRSLPCWKGEL